MDFVGVKRPEENWTKLPNCIVDNCHLFPPACFKLIVFMVRKTFGYQNPNYKFGQQYLAQTTGMSYNTVQAALRHLLGMRAIVKLQDATGVAPAMYAVNWVTENDIEIDRVPKIGTVGYQKLVPVKENSSKETILSSGKSTAAKTFRESLKMSGKGYKKKVDQEYHQFTIPLITFWNDCAGKVAKGLRPSQHSTGKHTVTLAHIDEVTRALASGAFAERYPAEAAKCQTAGANNIPDALLKKVWTLEDMKAALQSYFLHYEDGYWPHGTENKKKLPRSLATVMLSSRADTRPSWLLSMAANPPQPKEELLDPLVYEVVVRIFTKYGKAPSALDRKALQGAANALYREYQRIDKSILPACTLNYYSYFGTLKKFLSNYRAYLEYLFECERDGLRVAPGMFRPGTKTWEGFVDWMQEQHSVIISFGDKDPETWGGNRLQNVQREFRQEVHKKGLETARKWYGDRIPYLTYEEQQEKMAAWKDKYPKEDRRSMLWGIQLYHEIMGKRK